MPESVAELRKQLRELRKEAVKAPSKMTKVDLAMEIEKLKHHSATTPAVAQQSPSDRRPQKSTAPTMKELQEHPLLTPAQEKMAAVRAKKTSKSAPVKEAASESKMSKKQMMAMMKKMMEDSDEEC